MIPLIFEPCCIDSGDVVYIAYIGYQCLRSLSVAQFGRISIVFINKIVIGEAGLVLSANQRFSVHPVEESTFADSGEANQDNAGGENKIRFTFTLGDSVVKSRQRLILFLVIHDVCSISLYFL